MIAVFIAAIRTSMAARRRYARVVAEIESMADRELLGLGADPSDLVREARAETDGASDSAAV